MQIIVETDKDVITLEELIDLLYEQYDLDHTFK